MKQGVAFPMQEETMAVVSTNIKIESDLKRDAQTLFEELGMTLSTAVNIFLRQALREHGIPFRIGDPFYSQSNQRALQRASEDLHQGRVVKKTLEELEDMES